MIKDSINLYNNFKYLLIKCYSCGSLDHVVTHCPNLHVTVEPAEVIKAYLAEEESFRKNFPRRPRKRFHAVQSVEVLSEAASQVQIGHQTEVQYSMNSVDEELGPMGSYSSIDEILERRIYNIQPLDYVEDTTHMKFLDLAGAFRPQSTGTLAQLPPAKKNRQKIGEIETFMKNNYDPYYHNLNLDRVRNFEVYCPNNNIARLMTEFEKVRLEKIIEMRLGIKTKHISTLLVKSFRMNERKGQVPGTVAPIVKRSSIRKQSIVKKKKEKKEPVISPVRRDSVNSNPGDIALYNSNSIISNIRRPSQYKPLGKTNLPSPGISPLGSSTLLGVPPDGKKADSFELMLGKIGKAKEPDLSIIRENSVEKFGGKGTFGSGSMESPLPSSVIPFDFKPGTTTTAKKFNSSIDLFNVLPGMRTPEQGSGTPTSHAYYNGKINVNLVPEMNTDEYKLMSYGDEEEKSPGPGINLGIDYGGFMQKFTDKLSENSKYTLTRQTIRTDLEKEHSNTGGTGEKEKTISSELKITEGNNRLFNMLLHDRTGTGGIGEKGRASSEDRGRDVNKFIEKHNIPGLLKKMSSIYDDSNGD